MSKENPSTEPSEHREERYCLTKKVDVEISALKERIATLEHRVDILSAKAAKSEATQEQETAAPTAEGA